MKIFAKMNFQNFAKNLTIISENRHHCLVTIAIILLLSTRQTNCERTKRSPNEAVDVNTRGTRAADFNYCGSRLVDKINQMCDSRIWEPNRCMLATRYLCRRGRMRNHPICHFRCTTARKRRSSSYDSAEERKFIGQLREMLLRTHLPGHTLSEILGAQERGRRKRNIYAKCCFTTCSVSLVRDYCAA